MSVLHRTWNRSDRFYLTGITWLAFALRVVGLDRPSMWHDEAYNWLMITAWDVGQTLQIALAHFVHPPLYYLLTRPVAMVSDTEFVLRLTAAFAGTLAVPVIYLVGRELDQRRVGLVGALLLAVNPFHIWFSREARSYALAGLLTMVVMYLFLRIVRGKKGWIAFTLVNAVAFFIHYFALMLPLVQFIFFLITFRRRYHLFRRWVASMAVAGMPLLVWLILLFSQEEQAMGIAWIPSPAPWAPLLTLGNFSLVLVGEWTLLAAVALPFFAVALFVGARHARGAGILLLWLFVPMIAIQLVSWGSGRNLYVDRYFIISLAAYLLVVAAGTTLPARRSWRTLLLVALLTSSLAATARTMLDPRLQKEDWRAAMEILAAEREPGDLVVFHPIQEVLPASYYLPDLQPWVSLNLADEADGLATVIAEHAPDRIWLVYVNRIGSNHLLTAGGPTPVLDVVDSDTCAWLVSHSAQIIAEHTLPGINVLLIDIPDNPAHLGATQR